MVLKCNVTVGKRGSLIHYSYLILNLVRVFYCCTTKQPKHSTTFLIDINFLMERSNTA